MNARTWHLIVHDARGRRRRGRVTYADAPPDVFSVPAPPDEFSIVILPSAGSALDIPERTAVCSPGVPRIHALGDAARQDLPRRIEELTLTPQRMAAYAAGTITTVAPGLIEPADVFPPHSEHPRLDRLALALLEAADADAIAPYLALIRSELGLRASADPLAALASRLMPEEPKDRPPARAPGILRLARALRRLRADQVPETPLSELAEDLRFLRLFDDKTWSPEALNRLLDDVTDEQAGQQTASSPSGGDAAPTPARKSRKRPANVVPMRRRSAARAPEDA